MIRIVLCMLVSQYISKSESTIFIHLKLNSVHISFVLPHFGLRSIYRSIGAPPKAPPDSNGHKFHEGFY